MRQGAKLADAAAHAVEGCARILQAIHRPPNFVNHSVDEDEDQALNRRIEMSSRHVKGFANQLFVCTFGLQARHG